MNPPSPPQPNRRLTPTKRTSLSRNDITLMTVLSAVVILVVSFTMYSALNLPVLTEVAKNADGSATVAETYRDGSVQFSEAPPGTYELSPEEAVTAGYREMGLAQKTDTGFVTTAQNICDEFAAGHDSREITAAIMEQTGERTMPDTAHRMIEIAVQALCPDYAGQLHWLV